MIGAWLASRPVRERVVLATKVSTKPNRPGLSADNIRRALVESLSRLRTDVIDIYYAHFDNLSGISAAAPVEASGFKVATCAR